MRRKYGERPEDGEGGTGGCGSALGESGGSDDDAPRAGLGRVVSVRGAVDLKREGQGAEAGAGSREAAGTAAGGRWGGGRS